MIGNNNPLSAYGTYKKDVMIFVSQVPKWSTGCISRDLVKLPAHQKQVHCIISTRDRRFYLPDFYFPIAVMSYGYQIMSSSVKLTTLKRYFSDISENVYMFPVWVKKFKAQEGFY